VVANAGHSLRQSSGKMRCMLEALLWPTYARAAGCSACVLVCAVCGVPLTRSVHACTLKRTCCVVLTLDSDAGPPAAVNLAGLTTLNQHNIIVGRAKPAVRHRVRNTGSHRAHKARRTTSLVTMQLRKNTRTVLGRSRATFEIIRTYAGPSIALHCTSAAVPLEWLGYSPSSASAAILFSLSCSGHQCESAS
jgi:hypothetical protein